MKGLVNMKHLQRGLFYAQRKDTNASQVLVLGMESRIYFFNLVIQVHTFDGAVVMFS